MRKNSEWFGLAIVAMLFFGAASAAKAQKLDESQKDWIKKYQKQQNAPEPSKMLLNTDPEPQITGAFKRLFGGDNLDRWEARGGTCEFTVDGECIVGKVVKGSNSTYLCTKNEYDDFLFTCEMKWDVDVNSGVMFRAKIRKDGNKETVYGPQAEMEGFSRNRGWSGGIYGQSCGGFFYPLWLEEHRDARKALKEGEWNKLTILAKGNTIKTWVNGVPAAHWVDDGTYAKGYFGLQIHKADKGTVRWRNLRYKPIFE